MSFQCSVRILGLPLLLANSLYPCDIVVVGGYLPTVVGQVRGTVVGSARIDWMGKSHDEDRRSSKVVGARISVQKRTDTEFFKKGEMQPAAGGKPSGGKLKEWVCGTMVAQTRSDQAGNFAISEIKAGKYCLVIDGPENKVAGEAPMHESFLIDVVASGPKATLVADVSPRWADCSGGGSLILKPDE